MRFYLVISGELIMQGMTDNEQRAIGWAQAIDGYYIPMDGRKP
jgi:hypothetical protein